MWNDRIDEQTIALAGLYQACQIVSKIAWNGEYNEQELEPLISCIIKVDSTNTENIYLNVSKLESGLVYFRKQIVGDIFTRSSETRRYISSLEALVNKVDKSDEMISDIGKSIDINVIGTANLVKACNKKRVKIINQLLVEDDKNS